VRGVGRRPLPAVSPDLLTLRSGACLVVDPRCASERSSQRCRWRLLSSVGHSVASRLLRRLTACEFADAGFFQVLVACSIIHAWNSLVEARCGVGWGLNMAPAHPLRAVRPAGRQFGKSHQRSDACLERGDQGERGCRRVKGEPAGPEGRRVLSALSCAGVVSFAITSRHWRAAVGATTGM